jgi:hypothetical protein
MKSSKQPNQAIERTVTRRAFMLCVAATFSLRPTRGLGGRRMTVDSHGKDERQSLRLLQELCLSLCGARVCRHAYVAAQ